MNRIEEVNAKLKMLNDELPKAKTRIKRHKIMNEISSLYEEKIILMETKKATPPASNESQTKI